MWWRTVFFLVPKHQFIIIDRWIQVSFQLLHFSFISLCSSQPFAAANIDARYWRTPNIDRRIWTIENNNGKWYYGNGQEAESLCEWLLFLWCRKRCHNRSPFLWIIMTLWIVFFPPPRSFSSSFFLTLCILMLTHITPFRLKYELSWYLAFSGIRCI